MARSFNGSTQYGSYSGAGATAVPLTIAAWCNQTSFTAESTICTICTNSGGTGSNNAFWLATTTGGVIQATPVAANSGANRASSSVGATVNTWFHAAAVFTSSVLRAAYLNGGSKGTNTTSTTPGATMNTTAIGTILAGSATPIDFFPGLLAECAIWGAALTDAEIAALASGVQPWRVRTQAILGYWPLWGLYSPEPSLVDAGSSFTLTASPTRGNHAPVAMFTSRRPTLTYPPNLPPTTGGTPGLFVPGIFHGGRM